MLSFLAAVRIAALVSSAGFLFFNALSLGEVTDKKSNSLSCLIC